MSEGVIAVGRDSASAGDTVSYVLLAGQPSEQYNALIGLDGREGALSGVL